MKELAAYQLKTVAPVAISCDLKCDLSVTVQWINPPAHSTQIGNLFLDFQFIFHFFTQPPWNHIIHDDGVFNECKISDQESDDDIASINSKDNDDDADDDDD